jgi:hypothetical protein
MREFIRGMIDFAIAGLICAIVMLDSGYLPTGETQPTAEAAYQSALYCPTPAAPCPNNCNGGACVTNIPPKVQKHQYALCKMFTCSFCNNTPRLLNFCPGVTSTGAECHCLRACNGT